MQWNKKEKNSNTEIKFDKFGNKFSQLETINEVDKEKIKKEHITSLSRNNTNSPLADNVDNLDDKNDSQIIDTGLTNKRKMKNWKMIMYIYRIIWKIFSKAYFSKRSGW